MHDQTAVYVEHTLAHVNMLLQKGLHLIGSLEKEDIRGIGDESLDEKRECEKHIRLTVSSLVKAQNSA